MRIKVNENLALFGKDCIFVSSLLNDDDFMEFFRIAYTLASLGSRSRMFIIPYLGRSILEGSLLEGVISHIKSNAQLFSALSTYGFGNSFLFMDLHEAGFLHYLEGSSLHVELSSLTLLLEELEKQHYNQEPYMFVAADLGRPKVVNFFAEKCKVELAFIRRKVRTNGLKWEQIPPVISQSSSPSSEISNSVGIQENAFELVGEVKGKNVIIYDDLVRSTTTLVTAANLLKTKGALSVKVVVSHLCTNKESILKIRNNVCKIVYILYLFCRAYHKHPLNM